MYQAIDQEKTGIKLKNMLRAAGYDVKFIQEYLHLACPQPIYRWFKGKVLPSVENLCAISKLLGVHMEELLVLHGQSADDRDNETASDTTRMTRVLSYAKYFQKIA
ncbi:MAG: helix-turn-helix transcriptional regulator [Lachnospiraceae bacterium]|nr:helix-turn-helix transcriptional regulator [Lachnospiraceae bacterium]